MNQRQSRADDQVIHFVRALPGLRRLDDPAFEELCQSCSMRVLEAGRHLFRQDDDGDSFAVLISGKLELYRVSADGEETLIHIVDRDQAFTTGMTVAFGDHPFSARAIGAVRAMVGPRALLERLFKENGAAAMDYCGALSGHIRDFADHIEELRVMPAFQRLRAFLGRLGVPLTVTGVTDLPYKKIFIARAIGVTPETLSRLLAKMRGAEPHPVALAGLSVDHGWSTRAH